MKRTLYITGIILWSAFAFLACEKVDVDNEKPVITVRTPAEDEAVTPGSAIHFEVLFSDNEALASYKVDIHGAFDNHTHSAAATAAGRSDQVLLPDGQWTINGTGSADSDKVGGGSTGLGTQNIGTRAATDSVAFEKTWLESDFIALGATPIAGKKQATVAHQHIVIPESVNGKPLREGHYHFIVYCTDQSGQESFVAQEIVISY
ncbi:MAG: DUF4625 domain-containing protein [Porphyromonadaceae bacterium]|nr:DUF4625 domain-containing protein [Porphyromonadaceae bacterium]